MSTGSAPGRNGKVHATAAVGFQNQAEVYEQVRPSYPPQAVDFIARVVGIFRDKPTYAESTSRNEGVIIGDGEIRLLDLAAGTGKFTRLLLGYPNVDITAVEPVENMRKVFQRTLPASVPIVEGDATEIPFDNQHFDAVTVAQAFHWFANIDALREMHRVTKLGGALVLVWNMEDKSAPWVAELREAYEHYDEAAPQYRRGTWKDVFSTDEAQTLYGALQHRFFMQEMMVTKEQVWARVLSKSYIASLGGSDMQVLKSKVEEILERHDEEFCIVRDGERCAVQPLQTEVAWAYAKPSS